jgi:hypothetical protein
LVISMEKTGMDSVIICGWGFEEQASDVEDRSVNYVYAFAP